MLISLKNREKLNLIFQKIKLLNHKKESSSDKEAKIEQILAYLEMVHAVLKHYSPKRNINLIDCAAGNCYLSYLIYYFYKEIEPKNITIHCLDINKKLMDKSRNVAADLGFDNMEFHALDILDFSLSHKVDLVYSLHACDKATDKTLYLGASHNATNILSVSCCQHSLKKALRNSSYKGITRHKIFKDRLTYMVGDSLRALLLESRGYKTDIFDFVSSRYTDKNTMLRAKKAGHNKQLLAQEEYQALSSQFNVKPELELYFDLHNETQIAS